jgi:hypothetical protein
LQCRSHYLGRIVPATGTAIIGIAIPHFEQAIPLVMKLIKTHFILYPQQYKHGRRHTNRKAGDIDKRKTFFSQQIPPGDEEEILDHGKGVLVDDVE